MEKKIQIGCQGAEGSNNHKAVLEFTRKMSIDHYAIQFLVTSQNVVDALESGTIDFGVMAVSTAVAGPVQETAKALKGHDLMMLSTVSFNIHHCVFVKDPSIVKKDIKKVASHIEALRECQDRIKREFPDADVDSVEDTAIAASYLADGKLGKDTAVVCSEVAGRENGLYLMIENCEDLENNDTTFGLFKK